MATTPHITPLRVTEPPAPFTHTTVSRAFSRLNAAVAQYIEYERDLEHADCFDTAFLHWATDAERARAQVLDFAEVITTAPIARREDRPLKRSAMLIRALVECGSDTAFTALHRLLDTYAPLFTCPAPGTVAARVQQMLETCHEQVEALAELGEFNDPVTAWGDNAPAIECVPLTPAPAL